MQYKSLSNKIQSSFLIFRNNSSLSISSYNTVSLFFLISAFLLSSILLIDNNNNDNTALAFKPTVLSDQNENQLQQKQQQATNNNGSSITVKDNSNGHLLGASDVSVDSIENVNGI
ncbi:MAG TPA: hypothetical protein VJ583_07520 [Nitrososphaeraceae archaeon]|nr:hypothetical protein [Nitrososphaeraceae archaeon]